MMPALVGQTPAGANLWARWNVGTGASSGPVSCSPFMVGEGRLAVAYFLNQLF